VEVLISLGLGRAWRRGSGSDRKGLLRTMNDALDEVVFCTVIESRGYSLWWPILSVLVTRRSFKNWCNIDLK
jgi:hypothetical protein